MNFLFRKIIGNLVVGIFVPFLLKIRWLPNVYDAVFYREYKYYDFEFNSLSEFLKEIYWNGFLLEYFLGLLFILLPFQLIKDHYKRKNKPLSFFSKFRVLAGIVISWVIIFGLFSNIWTIPWWHNFIYVAFALFFSLVITTLLYILVDIGGKKSGIE